MTPRIVGVTPAATDEEVAAIAAALAVVEAEAEAAASAGAGAERPPGHLDMWVEASRRSAQRAGLQRGPWRLSGRVGRRARA